MGHNKDKAVEAQISKALPKAVKQLLKDLENEPTLVIELKNNETGALEETISDIRAWLFRRS